MVADAFAGGIYRAEAHVRVGNTASERVLERAGFTREGIRRGVLRHEGQRVDATLFSKLVGRVSKRLVVYLMCGRETPELADAAVDGGADLVELGFPFSDPLADGPVVRAAAERALAEGMRTAACLECLADVRERVDVPLVPMTYASLFEAYGWERLERDARAAGADSLIVADLPADERPDLRRVQLVAPTSTDERLRTRRRAHRRMALPRHADRHDRRPRCAVPIARTARRAHARADGRSALRGLRDLDAPAGGRGGGARRRRRRRLGRAAGSRGRAGGAARLRRHAAVRAGRYGRRLSLSALAVC